MALLDVPAADALARLSDASGMRLLWQPETIGARGRTRISCRLERSTAEDVLRCITRKAGLDFYRLSSGTYVVIVAAEAPSTLVSIAGFVTDAESGSPIPAATLRLAEEGRDVVAGGDGGFSIGQLRPGRHAVTVRALGYRPLVTSVELDGSAGRQARFALQRAEVVMSPIVVNGLRPGVSQRSLGSGDLAGREVRGVVGPALFLPGGVAPLGIARRDGTGDLHVQGGDLGEHPWRLDGIPLYDVSSLSGLLGAVAPGVVQRLEVRRSGFRASEGSFAAGVIDLTHALGGEDTPGVDRDLAVDPVAATGRVSVPLRAFGGTGRAMVAGRVGLWPWTAPGALVRALRAWSVPDPVLLARVGGFGTLPGMAGLDTTTYTASAGEQRVGLGDGHAAARLAWGLAHQLDASAFTTGRSIAYEGTAPGAGGASVGSSDTYAWRTTGGQLTHRWLLGTRVRQRVQLRGVRHALEHDVSMAMLSREAAAVSGGESNALTELALSGEWRLAAGAHTDLALGAEVTRAEARLDLANQVLRPLALASTATRASAFADATIQLPRGLVLDAGVRATQLQGGQTFGEPRLALRQEGASGGRGWGWRIAGGGYHQFVSQFDVASTMPVALVPSVRFWWPADAATPVAQAWHLAAEGVWQPGPGWEVRAEGYTRWHPSLPMFDYGVMFDDQGQATVTDPSQVIVRSSGRASGAGVRVTRDARLLGTPWRSEVAVDAGAAERRFPSRFGGQLQSPAWLEPWRLLVASELRPHPSLTVALRGRGIRGRPWALRQVYYDLFGAAPGSSNLPIEMPGMMIRPAILELDAGATYERRVGGVAMELGASLTNATGRANVLDYGLRRRNDANAYAMVPRFLPGRQLAVTLRLRG